MNHTPNFQLTQWERSDRILMEDFNADNAKIDAALGALAGRVEYGSYVGTGVYGETEASATQLSLGYTPKLLIVKGETGGTAIFVWASKNATYLYSPGTGGTTLVISWLEDGLKWYLSSAYRMGADAQLNSQDVTYYYIAFR